MRLASSGIIPRCSPPATRIVRNATGSRTSINGSIRVSAQGIHNYAMTNVFESDSVETTVDVVVPRRGKCTG
jgi:hypothetical protein